MKLLNLQKWSYDRVKALFNNKPDATRINCGIIAFNDLLSDSKANKYLDPMCVREILQTGYYANLEIDSKSLEIHVNKKYGASNLYLE